MEDFAFIFDLDGTLLNSTDIGKDIQDKVMKKFKIEITPEKEKELGELAESMMNEDYTTWLAIKIIWTLLKEVWLSFRQRLDALKYAGKIYKVELRKLKLYDGVEEIGRAHV